MSGGSYTFLILRLLLQVPQLHDDFISVRIGEMSMRFPNLMWLCVSQLVSVFSFSPTSREGAFFGVSEDECRKGLGAGVSNLHPAGRMQPRVAVNLPNTKS